MNLEKFKKNFYQGLELGQINSPETNHDITINDESSLKTKNQIVRWFDLFSNFGFLEDFITCEDTEEIILHSPFEISIITSKGRYFTTQDFLDSYDWDYFCLYQTLKNNIPFNQSSPFQSFLVMTNLKNSTQSLRVSLIHKNSMKSQYHKIFIRKNINKEIKIVDYFDSPELHENLFLSILDKKENILISGSTGSGKTTFLKSLIRSIPEAEHLITIEDTSELNLKRKNISSFLAKDSEQYSMKKYCEYAMRMRPDRILLGEIRGSEVIPYLLTLNTGHGGCAATIHANSAIDSFNRFATLFELYHQGDINYSLILKMLAKSIKWVIHLEDKKIKEVIKVLSSENERVHYEKVYGVKDSGFSRCAFNLSQQRDAI